MRKHAFTKSHHLTVWSPLEVTKWDPLGWNATPETQSVWPSPDIISSPFGKVQIFHVWSSPTLARIALYGWITTQAIAIICLLYVLNNEKDSTFAASISTLEYGFGLFYGQKESFTVSNWIWDSCGYKVVYFFDW